MKRLLLAVLVVWGLAANGFSAFKVVAIPDTQNMAQYAPAAMKAQEQWIVNHVSSDGIAFVTHLGDVVNDGYDTTQWSHATDALDLLDGAVPYSVCCGNHDYHNRTNRLAGAAEYIARFGSSRYSGYSWYKGTHKDLNHYQIFSADGRDWLHINLEYQPDGEDLMWAQRVIDAHPTLPVILSTHDCLAWTGELGNTQYPDRWGAPSNGGKAMWYRFIKQNDQIFLVLNGHVYDESTGWASAHTNIVNSYGHDTTLMCVNFQQVANDDAHLRILEFDSSSDEINITTYDPYHDDYLTDAPNQYTINLDFSARLGSFSARETFPSIQAANVTVVENNLNNSNNSVTVTIPSGQSTAAISVIPVGTDPATDHNNGDYFLQVGSHSGDDFLGGVMLASVAENGRTSMDGTNYYCIAQARAGSHGAYYVATATTANEDQYPGAPSGIERDVNVGVAYFPFAQGWTCGRVEAYNDNKPSTSFVGSDNIELGVNLTQIPQGDVDTNLLQHVGGSGAPYWPNPENDRGIWNLEIPGVDSISDGILLVCGGDNEDNFATASPWRDGSGWQIALMDSGDSGGSEAGTWNFVYVPYATTNIVAGRGNTRGGSISGTGGFTLTSNAVGRVRLDIEGQSPSSGTLILSSENEWYNADDFVTYEPEGDHWIIEDRDLPGATLASAGSSQFAFLFIPFTNAPSGPPQNPAAVWNTPNGDWMTAANWDDTEAMRTWGVPGYVVGNPLNTGGSTDPDWNKSEAYIQSGTANITPASHPDGHVASLDVGRGANSATLNIGADLVVDGNATLGDGSDTGTVCIVNQTAGNVVMGSTEGAGHRTYFGRGDGHSYYNLSGGSLTLPADYNHFARSGHCTFTFNLSGGVLTNALLDTYMEIGVVAGSTGIVNITGGTLYSGSKHNTYVGEHGYGEINQSAGLAHFHDYLDMSRYPDGYGVYNLSGGVLDVPTTMNVGNYNGGDGLFNQTGGESHFKYVSMALGSGASAEIRISGGSMIVTNSFHGDQSDWHAGRFTVSGSGATSIRAMRYYGWADITRFELDGGGSTLFEVTKDTGGTYDYAYADLRNEWLEMDTLPGYNAASGTVFNVLWVDRDPRTGSTEGYINIGSGGEYAPKFINDSSTPFAWRINPNVTYNGKSGQMLQLVATPMYDSRYVEGLEKRLKINSNPADTNVVDWTYGLAFDPSSKVGGVYNRLYLLDTDPGPQEGLYALDWVNETRSALLMGNHGDQGTNPYDVTVDRNGNAYVAYDDVSAVWKLSDPLGSAVQTQLIGTYTGGDDDPYALAMAPVGFGGGFNATEDIVMYDAGMENNDTESITVIDKDSIATEPKFSVIWQYTTGKSWRIATSDYDGMIYMISDGTALTDTLGGTNRIYLYRMDSAGNRTRIFLDGLLPSDIVQVDDSIAVNPVDGSVWFPVEVPDQNTRSVIRVDIANAVAQGGGDYLASACRPIYNIGNKNVAVNGITISPDGKLLAFAGGYGSDSVHIFRIKPYVPPFDAWKAEYGLEGSDAESSADPDGDGLDNLYEYALGGDPTNAANQGIPATYCFSSDASGAWMDYVYPQRSDPDSGIAYHIEVNDDLVFGDWVNANYEVVGTGTIDSEFDSVTNRIPTDSKDEQFVRLIVEEQE